MITFRQANRSGDIPSLSSLDTSFVTGRVYRVVHSELSFELIGAEVDPPLRKTYAISYQETWDYAVVAEDGGAIVGFAAVEYQRWNRRAVIWHLYVSPDHRRLGIATQLLSAVTEYAKTAGARCLWLETQNVNYPAIQFYLRSGFRLCGFDDTLYDPDIINPQEVALFFTRPVV